ncbi:hypothetical protein SAMN05444000_101193 [Shimia gijangensis]|uniref:TPR repeat n=1 Tax=Shimia gijangensis TaxID=1470563 RepID=A0A1M6BD93_9RHOB|nr:tetratricopeptide repeat protein [Shimia gijangensis]SHI46666.1 hypothetical protein SAMN05444000_101193 [Shimia gijangensis]
MNLFTKIITFACVAGLAFTGIAQAEDDQWTVLDPDHSYYDENLPKAQIQNGPETLMVKIDPMTGKWIATLVLIGDDQDTAISNVLSAADGQKVKYKLNAGDENLYTNFVGDQFSVFSFPLAQDFVQAAKTARFWAVSSDLGISIFRMTNAGSEEAIFMLEMMADDIGHSVLQAESDEQQAEARCEAARQSGETLKECDNSALASSPWEYAEVGSNFYIDGAYGAATKTERELAALYWVHAGQQWVAMIKVDTEHYVDEFTSRIHLANGKIQVKEFLEGAFMRSQDAGETQQALTFQLSKNEMQMLRAATDWTIHIGGETHGFTLSNVVAATDEIVHHAEAFLESQNENNQETDEAIATCDAEVGHPDDSQQPTDGVAWADIDAMAAVQVCERALDLAPDNVRMLYQLGRAYDKADNPDALWVLQDAADMGYPEAFNHLGLLYWDGDYTDQDHDKARAYFSDGSDLGSLSARYNYARILVQQGDGKQDLVLAYDAMNSAADAGYLSAQELMGDWMREGTLGDVSFYDAHQHYEAAAEQGSGRAYYALSQMYTAGEGVTAEPSKALSHLFAAGNLGHEQARKDLGWD